MTRLTNSDVIHLLAEQLPRWLRPDDFFPVPCCFPTCRSVTCLLTDGTAGDASFGVLPVPPLLDVEDYLDYVSNRVVPDFAVREALERLWSAPAFMGSDPTAERLDEATSRLTAVEPAGRRRPADRGHRASRHGHGPDDRPLR